MTLPPSPLPFWHPDPDLPHAPLSPSASPSPSGPGSFSLGVFLCVWRLSPTSSRYQPLPPPIPPPPSLPPSLRASRSLPSFFLPPRPCPPLPPPSPLRGPPVPSRSPPPPSSLPPSSSSALYPATREPNCLLTFLPHPDPRSPGAGTRSWPPASPLPPQPLSPNASSHPPSQSDAWVPRCWGRGAENWEPRGSSGGCRQGGSVSPPQHRRADLSFRAGGHGRALTHRPPPRAPARPRPGPLPPALCPPRRRHGPAPAAPVVAPGPPAARGQTGVAEACC
nr:vegetative cell wall protein gp1-like [Manis javanica]